MKKKGLITLLCAAVICVAAFLISCTNDDGVMSKKKGVYIVNTTTLSANVKGYNGPTPLLITIKNDRIVKIEALENTETPGFFKRMKDAGLLNKWNGLTVDQALAAKVDVVAGATYSSNAVIENVRLGLKYYKDHK